MIYCFCSSCLSLRLSITSSLYNYVVTMCIVHPFYKLCSGPRSHLAIKGPLMIFHVHSITLESSILNYIDV